MLLYFWFVPELFGDDDQVEVCVGAPGVFVALVEDVESGGSESVFESSPDGLFDSRLPKNVLKS